MGINEQVDIKVTPEEREAAEKWADKITSRIEYGECKNKKCRSKNYPQAYLDDNDGLCFDCIQAKEKTVKEKKLQLTIKFSQDVKYKKVRGYREINRTGY